MSKSGPEWIDEVLSEELPLLRDRGEGQHLEFMVSYPQSGYELSREIAAFASSNAGTILIGVADDGSLVGLDNVDAPSARDSLCRRIEGVCAGNVRPAITPTVRFAQEDGVYVLVIGVPRGSQPIYYSKNTPYVRHLSSSRPAEPHEVIDRIAEWLGTNPLASAEPDDESAFASALVQPLIDVLICGQEFEQRNVNPWLDMLRIQLTSSGEELRRFAADDAAIKNNIQDRLLAISDSLDAVGAHRLSMGKESWGTLTGHVAKAVSDAEKLKSDFIDKIPFSQESKAQLGDMVKRTARELADLDRRAESMTQDGRMEQLQESASQLGRSLLVAAHYLSSEPDAELHAALQEIGRSLHLIETERLYMDGGQSVRRIVEKIHELNTRVQELVAERAP